MTDGELLRSFTQEKSEEAFCALVERHSAMVYRTCLRCLRGRRDQAEDAVQAAFMVLAQKAGSIRHPERLGVWLYQTARRVSENLLRQERRARRKEERLKAMREQSETMTTDDSSPTENLDEARVLLDQAMDSLRPKQREAVVLCYLENRTRSDVARILDCSPNSLTKRLTYAVEKLHAFYARRGMAISVPVLTECLRGEAAALIPSTVSSSCHQAGWSVVTGNVVAAKASSIADSTLRYMFWSRACKLSATAAGVVLAASISTMMVMAEEPRPIVAQQPAHKSHDKPRPEPIQEPQRIPAVRILGKADFQAPSTISAVAFSPDSKHIAAAYHGGVVVWDLKTHQEVSRAQLGRYIYDIEYVDEGRQLLILGHGKSFRKLAPVWTWDLKTNGKLGPLGHGQEPDAHGLNPGRYFTVSPDKQTVLVAMDKGEKDDEVAAWDISTGKRLTGLNGIKRVAAQRSYGIDYMAFNADQTRLVCIDSGHGASGDARIDRTKRISIVDWTNRKVLTRWMLPRGTYLGYRSGVYWHPDGQHLILQTRSRGNKVGETLLVQAQDGKVTRKFKGSGAAGNKVRQLFLYDGKTIRVCDLRGNIIGDPVHVGKVGFGFIWASKLSSDNRWMAATLNNQTIMLVDLEEKRKVAPAGGHQKTPFWVLYAPTGMLLLHDGGSVKKYDDVTGRLISQFPGSIHYVAARQSINRDGRLMIASGKSKGQAEVWDVVSDKLLGHLNAHRRGGVKDTFISPLGQFAVTTGEYDGVLQIHDLKTGRPTASLRGPRHSFFGPTTQIQDCAFTESEETVYIADLTGCWFQPNDRKKMKLTGTIGLSGAYELKTGKRLFRFRDEHGSEIEDIANLELHRDQKRIYFNISGKGGGLWNAEDGSYIRKVEGPGPGAEFSDDGLRLVGPNGVTDVASGKLVHSFTGAGARCVSPSRTRVLSVEAGHRLKVYDVRTGSLVWSASFASAGFKDDAVAAVTWHPAEHQVVLNFKKNSAILQIDLFDAAHESQPTKRIGALIESLGSPDITARVKVAKEIFRRGEQAVKALSDAIEASAAATVDLRSLMAVGVLESLARERVKTARTVLRNLALGDERAAITGCAKDACLRLKAMDRARSLKEQHKQRPEPLEWPPEKTPEKDEEF